MAVNRCMFVIIMLNLCSKCNVKHFFYLHRVSPKKQQKLPKLTIKSPVRSPTKSPVRSPVKSPDKQPDLLSPTPETIHVSPTVTSPAKMVRRSQVTKSGSNASTQASSGRLRSLRVPSQVTHSWANIGKQVPSKYFLERKQSAAYLFPCL